MRNRYYFFVIFLFFILGIHCAGFTPKPYVKTDIPAIRVLLFQGKQADLLLQGDYYLTDEKGFKISINRNKHLKFKVTEAEDGIKLYVDEQSIFSPKEHFYLKWKTSNQGFRFHDRIYEGNLEIVLTNDQLQIINRLDLESYLKGVVPAEIGHLGKKEFEALKAQAIAARTYALRKLQTIQKQKQHKKYDLQPTINDQVYIGKTEHHKWSDWAVENTTGEVTMYRDSLIDAFYHSTCGGRTEFAQNVFTDNKISYLQGVADNFGDGDFCADSPYHRWVESFLFEELEQSIKVNKYLISDKLDSNDSIWDISILDRFESGRVKKLAIYFEHKKNPLVLSGNKIRRIIRREDGSMLRSMLFRIAKYGPKEKPEGFMLIGAGNGHGVGMCQWGAIGMARKGYSCAQILNHYYRGIDIKKIY